MSLPGFLEKMAKHEMKKCPECGAEFECKVGSIHLCQCWTVPLTEEERAYIKEKFDECLCASCLMEEKRRYHQQAFEKSLKKISKLF